MDDKHDNTCERIRAAPTGCVLDRYGPGAVLAIFEPPRRAISLVADELLDQLRPRGVRAIYVKHFAKDRSRLGGAVPAELLDPNPAAGVALPESFLVREHDWSLEVRLYDGFSTGLFLDQRDNRQWVAEFVRQRGATAANVPRGTSPPLSVLNTFAYTCAFSVAAALAGAATTSVDVSARYLEWGKRNFIHNQIDPALHRFARMDTFEFFAYARRKNLRYDLIILDPPSFAAGNRQKKIRPWSAENDYARLVREAAELLSPRGVIFASTNTQALSRPGRMEREIIKGLTRPPRWIDLPPPPADFADEVDRFAARAFSL